MPTLDDLADSACAMHAYSLRSGCYRGCFGGEPRSWFLDFWTFCSRFLVDDKLEALFCRSLVDFLAPKTKKGTAKGHRSFYKSFRRMPSYEKLKIAELNLSFNRSAIIFGRQMIAYAKRTRQKATALAFSLSTYLDYLLGILTWWGCP